MEVKIEGLDSERNWGFIWLAVCVVCWVLSPPTPAYGAGMVVWGILVGLIRTILFSKNQLKWGDRIIWLGILPLLPTIILGWMPLGVFGALGTGACISGWCRLVPWMSESYINRKLAEPLKPFLDAFNHVQQAPPEPDAALQELRQLKPNPLWDELESGRIPGFQLQTAEALSLEPTHLSCLGGAPDLPEGIAWPEHQGKPLSFMAHLNLAEPAQWAPPSVLPHSGSLLFFYDAQEQPWGYESDNAGSWTVIHLADPLWIQGPLLPLTCKPYRFFHIRDTTRSRIWELEKLLPENIRHHFGELGFALDPGTKSHQLLGAARLVQGDMDDELETARKVFGLPEDTPWTLLLQLDSESLLGWCWGDEGVLYFWIPTGDLVSSRFDRAWVVLQCC